MGAGFALAIKNTYPKAYEVYRNEYETKGLYLGDIQVVDIDSNLNIINMMTQDRTGTDPNEVYVSYEAVAKGFIKLSLELENKRKHFMETRKPNEVIILNVDFPMIGAGLARGDWNIISQIIDDCIPDYLANKRLFILE
jgi:O-acetyl-ADP-ribose deacetylase (regulator of RNase III)